MHCINLTFHVSQPGRLVPSPLLSTPAPLSIHHFYSILLAHEQPSLAELLRAPNVVFNYVYAKCFLLFHAVDPFLSQAMFLLRDLGYCLCDRYPGFNLSLLFLSHDFASISRTITTCD